MNDKRRRSVFVVLLHQPMVDRNGREVTTAVTNLDIHDIARSCRTYGVTKYFIVNSEIPQQRLIGSILGHWRTEISKVYHPARVKALDLVAAAQTFEEAFNMACLEGEGTTKKESKKIPYVVMPDARDLSQCFAPGTDSEPWSYEQLRRRMVSGDIPGDDVSGYRPVMVVFGTGWGISPSFFSKVDRVLKPLQAEDEAIRDYNHLSVRAAAAIILDRLLGDRN